MGGDTDPTFGIAAEEHGFGSIWYGGVGADLDIPNQVLAATDRIVIGSGVVNIFATDPRQVAESYHRLQSEFPARFILGIGLGHPERTELARRPLGALAAYLDTLLAEGVPPSRVMLASLGPRVLALAAERTAGALPYLVTPEHARSAREVLGGSALLIPEQRVVLDPDRHDALQIARPGVQFYLHLRNYRQNLGRLGFTTDELDSASPRVIDALVVSGTPAEVKAGLDAHLDAGADHVLAQVITRDGPDWTADVAALSLALGLDATAYQPGEAAALIREVAAEITSETMRRFSASFPGSVTNSLPEADYRKWVAAEVESLARIVENDVVDPTQYRRFFGDMVTQTSPLTTQVVNFVESRILLAEVVLRACGGGRPPIRHGLRRS